MTSLESASSVNIVEAYMVVRSLRYVLQQGYKHNEVVVLTPYLGQLRKLRQIMRQDGIQEVAGQRDEEALEAQGLQELEVH
jgi:superfamily I DNA and/or RNA helicase